MKKSVLPGLAALFTLFLAVPVFGQGLTISMQETGPTGKTSPSMQIDKTHARLDVPSLLSQVLYDTDTKIVKLLVPFTRTYKEYTSASRGAAPTQPAPATPVKITYRKTGTSKVKDWACTTYEGYRGAEKVVELCAAEGSAFGMTRADFTLVQQALDIMKGIAAQDALDRIPLYGNAESQGFVGFPVRRVSFREGKADVTTELVDFKREAVPATTFAVPAGFNKVQ